MKEAFPSWGTSEGPSISVPSDSGKRMELVYPSPRLVLAPDSAHRLLVVDGKPHDDSHAAGANLGLYGFTAREGRWFKTSELPSFAWVGEYGEVDEVFPLDLGAKRPIMATKHRYCSQGFCQTWLKVFVLREGAARLILEEQLGRGTNSEPEDPCDELVQAAAAGASTPKSYEGLAFSFCPATTSSMWVQKPEKDAWPDIEIRFKGQDFDVDKTSQAVKRTVIDETLVLRYNGALYVHASGRNPLSSAK